MSILLPDYESESEEDELQVKSIRNQHFYENLVTFPSLEDAVNFLKKRKFAYHYRVKQDPKNDRKVK